MTRVSGTSKAGDWAVTVAAKSLAPGTYVISIDARDKAGNDTGRQSGQNTVTVVPVC